RPRLHQMRDVEGHVERARGPAPAVRCQTHTGRGQRRVRWTSHDHAERRALERIERASRLGKLDEEITPLGPCGRRGLHLDLDGDAVQSFCRDHGADVARCFRRMIRCELTEQLLSGRKLSRLYGAPIALELATQSLATA